MLIIGIDGGTFESGVDVKIAVTHLAVLHDFLYNHSSKSARARTCWSITFHHYDMQTGHA